MKDELVGYVLRALDADVHDSVDIELEKDPKLIHDLVVLRDSFEPLAADEGHIDPPAGLASRCCQEVRRQNVVQPAAAAALKDTLTTGSRRSSRWSFSDLAIAAGVLIALGIVAVPTVNHSRFSAQLMSCQNNLRQVGQALLAYSSHDPAGTFPAIMANEHSGQPSSYATTLVSQNPDLDHRAFLCPSAVQGDGRQPCQPSELIELEKSSEMTELDRLLAQQGGNYAYTLGHRDARGVQRTRNLNRPTFAIMADAPCPSHNFVKTSHHGSCGQNVLFEDGHVGYEENCKLTGCHDDDLFHNRNNEIAPGVDQDDAVVGNPFARTRQP